MKNKPIRGRVAVLQYIFPPNRPDQNIFIRPGFAGDRIRYVISRDDGESWGQHQEYYNPGRPISRRACPRTVQLDAETIGVVFYDIDEKQVGGPGLYFLAIPIAQLTN